MSCDLLLRSWGIFYTENEDFPLSFSIKIVLHNDNVKFRALENNAQNSNIRKREILVTERL